MRRCITVVAALSLAFLLAFGGGAAEAAQTFVYRSQSVVANTDPGLEIRTAPLVAAGDPSFTLVDVGDSFTFDLFRIWTVDDEVNLDDLFARPITATVTFNPPLGGSGSIGGTTDTAFLFFFFGVFTAGEVTWGDPVSVTAANGAQFSLELSDVTFNGGLVGSYTPGILFGRNVELTVTLTGQPRAVPEPGTLLSGALGLMTCAGGWFLRRRRAAAP